MRPGRLPLPLLVLIASIPDERGHRVPLDRGPLPSLVPFDDLPMQIRDPALPATFPAARIRETSATVGGQLATTLRPMRTGSTTRSGTDRARERNARRARRKNRKR